MHIKQSILYEQMFCDIGSDLHTCSNVDTKIRILDVFHGCVEYQGAIGVHVLGVGSLDIESQPLRIVELLGQPEVDKEALAGRSQTHLDAFMSIFIYLSICHLQALVSLHSIVGAALPVVEGEAAAALEVDAKEGSQGQEEGCHGAAHPVTMPLPVHGKLSCIVRPGDPLAVDALLEGDHVEATPDLSDRLLLQFLTSLIFTEVQLLNQRRQVETNLRQFSFHKF